MALIKRWSYYTCNKVERFFTALWFIIILNLEVDVYSKPIANYASLKIIRVTPPSKPDEFVPFTLSRLVSREYHVSEEGVVIGSGEECKVKVPVEAGLNDHHVEIRWIPGNSYEQYISMQ